MRKRLVLRRETLAELSTGDLAAVVAADASKLCPFTIGGSCGIVCHTAGLQCFTDGC